jgi:hypothetical protein
MTTVASFTISALAPPATEPFSLAPRAAFTRAAADCARSAERLPMTTSSPAAASRTARP